MKVQNKIIAKMPMGMQSQFMAILQTIIGFYVVLGDEFRESFKKCR